jgi:ATP-dependent exoDNAse (exonuclease V) alpha subunit
MIVLAPAQEMVRWRELRCSPACAASIHEGQALNYRAVVILTQHYAMAQRNLLYTDITRGNRLVVLVGQKNWSPLP